MLWTRLDVTRGCGFSAGWNMRSYRMPIDSHPVAKNATRVRGLRVIRLISVVPTGLVSLWAGFPALKRWAEFFCPSGALRWFSHFSQKAARNGAPRRLIPTLSQQRDKGGATYFNEPGYRAAYFRACFGIFPYLPAHLTNPEGGSDCELGNVNRVSSGSV
jgi:hypothetical protein